MAYNPTTDFVGLWRNNGTSVSKEEMPGVDFVVAALARAGVVSVTVAATAPVANQSTTAWLKTAVPSSSAEGTFWLWDATASAYAAATPALFLAFLQACAGESGAAWWTTTGAPSNSLGLDGDFAIRLDSPNGIYGPKAAGAWPLSPIAGTADIVTSLSLDNTFGTSQGATLFRGASVWSALPIGAPNTVLSPTAGSLPAWAALSALMDSLFGSLQGSVLYRDSLIWDALPPDATPGKILSTNGVGANPSWVPRTAEFASGTTMLFQQTTAPTGWTKQTAINDAGLRVVNGAAGITAGAGFSTVFSQTATGGHVLSVGEMPSHSHGVTDLTSVTGTGAGAGVGGGGGFGPPTAPSTTFSIAANGGGGAHTHPITLNLQYVDVIIATKN